MMQVGIQVKKKDRKEWQTFVDKWNKRNNDIRNTTKGFGATKKSTSISKKSRKPSTKKG